METSDSLTLNKLNNFHKWKSWDVNDTKNTIENTSQKSKKWRRKCSCCRLPLTHSSHVFTTLSCFFCSSRLWLSKNDKRADTDITDRIAIKYKYQPATSNQFSFQLYKNYRKESHRKKIREWAVFQSESMCRCGVCVFWEKRWGWGCLKLMEENTNGLKKRQIALRIILWPPKLRISHSVDSTTNSVPTKLVTSRLQTGGWKL